MINKYIMIALVIALPMTAKASTNTSDAAKSSCSSLSDRPKNYQACLELYQSAVAQNNKLKAEQVKAEAAQARAAAGHQKACGPQSTSTYQAIPQTPIHASQPTTTPSPQPTYNTPTTATPTSNTPSTPRTRNRSTGGFSISYD